MSAYIVSKSHIDAICSALNRYANYGLTWKGPNGRKSFKRGDSLNPIGQMLWHENVASVSDRYPDDKPGEWPGPIGLAVDTVRNYRYRPPKQGPTPIQALKLIDCLEYQSCEHDEWDTSEAKDFLDSLRRHLIHSLPGYEEARWSVD